MKTYLSIRDMSFSGKRVFVRFDLNTPIKDGKIKDDTRIRAALPTLAYLLDGGARVVACSHLGRPKGRVVPGLSLAPAAQRLRELMDGRRIFMATDVVGESAVKLSSSIVPGETVLLENVRFEPGETKGDEALAARLHALADLYVNDAFGTIHRPHVSVYALVRSFSRAGIGFLMEKELNYFSGTLQNPSRPYTAFLGGAKVSDKIPVITHLLDKVDNLCIGGAMAYTFLSAKGISTGASLMEENLIPTCGKILESAEQKAVNLLLPVDHRAALSLETPEKASVHGLDSFPDDLAAFDIGPETARAYGAVALHSATIFWNGPMGVFETPPFNSGTVDLARAIGESGATSVIGGGDIVAAVRAAGLSSSITHISTGGGASLALLAGEPLPGLEALSKR